jgi:1-deoxy-D-xylulose-5-phosphate synthase
MTTLHDIRGPNDLRRLSVSELAVLSRDIRRVLVDTVCRTGGHLGPNLGVVELTIALHRVFSSPHDHLIFDTGHQAYVHKLLTGRAEQFGRLRARRGLSDYPCRAESEHDLVENSHASTALSYADGLAKAIHLRGDTDRAVIAVVGDGALTGGMCWEALNNIGSAPDRPIIIVLNDNGRSYSPTTGALAAHLAALRANPVNHNVFEALGLAYLGPVDGHDIGALEHALRQARRSARPVLVHCVTRKGRGYRPAEEDEADRLHAVGPAAQSRPGTETSWTTIFSEELTAIGAQRPDVVAITAAMLRPTGLHAFSQAFPDRVFDVGIAEQHAVTSAAGLALGGLHPVVAIYATFLNRAFDQTLLDVALHGLPVTFVLDRAGITGPDGPSHHGMWDLSLLRIVSGLRVAAPRDAATLRAELGEAIATNGPTAIRFPKAKAAPDIPATDRIGPIDILHRDPLRDVLIVPSVPWPPPAWNSPGNWPEPESGAPSPIHAGCCRAPR